MGCNPKLGYEASLNGSQSNFMNLLITKSQFFGKHVKSSDMVAISALLFSFIKNDTDHWLAELPTSQRKTTGSVKQNYHYLTKDTIWLQNCLNVRNAPSPCNPENGGINQSHKSEINKIEHNQPRGVKPKMGECKLGRGIAAKTHKTSVWHTSQNMGKFNFTRTWRLTLDIRAIRGATVLTSGSCRSMSMHLCFKVFHLQCACSQNYQQSIL
jgi:hypothetical protein